MEDTNRAAAAEEEKLSVPKEGLLAPGLILDHKTVVVGKEKLSIQR